MAADPRKTTYSDEEIANVDAAVEDWYARGSTERSCLRCGRPLHVRGGPSGYTAQCETDGCLKLTFRGI